MENKTGQPTADSPPTTRSFVGRALIVSLVAISLLALGVFLWYSIHVLLLIFAGILISILLRGLSDWVSQWTKLPHVASLALVLLIVIGSLVGVVWLSYSRLESEASDLSEQLPRSVHTLKQKAESSKLGSLILRETPDFGGLLGGNSGDLVGNVTGVVSTTLGVIVSTLVVLFTGLYLAATPRMYVRGVLHLVPRDRRDRASEVLGAIGYTLKWWMIGQGLDMLILGVATASGFWLLKVPLAAALGFVAGVFNFVPNFGPLFSLVPAVLMTLPTDPSKALYVVIFVLVLQNIEGYVVMPLIQGRTANIPGAVVIVAQVLMGLLAGGLGLVLAAPLAAAVIVAVKMIYVEDALGDRIQTPADGPAKAEVREVRQAAAEVARDQKPS